jgi:hypothetical protein
MALKSWVFIYTAPGIEPEGRVHTVETSSSRTLLVGMPDVDAAVRFAGTVDREVQLVELCGAFGPVGTARVIDALGGRVPVGAVTYGGEAVDALHAIFTR